MAEPQAVVRWTVEMLDALPDDETLHYEIVDGELFVSKSPRTEHQITCNRIAVPLTNWNDATGLGVVIPQPGIIFTRHDAVEPDVVWVSRVRLAQIQGDDGHLHGAPELVVEVLSPGSANERRDRQLKLALYAREGVKEYWLADWRTRTIEVYRQHDGQLSLLTTLVEGDTLTTPLLPGFAVAVSRLFER